MPGIFEVRADWIGDRLGSRRHEVQWQKFLGTLVVVLAGMGFFATLRMTDFFL